MVCPSGRDTALNGPSLERQATLAVFSMPTGWNQAILIDVAKAQQRVCGVVYVHTIL